MAFLTLLALSAADDHDEVFVKFTCHSNDTVSVLEHCDDNSCSDCKVRNASLQQGECYIVDETVHVVTCGASNANATVQILHHYHTTRGVKKHKYQFLFFGEPISIIISKFMIIS